MNMGFLFALGPWEVIIILFVMGVGLLVALLVVFLVLRKGHARPVLRCECGSVNPSGSRYCNQCGRQLTASLPNPPEQSG